MRVLIVSQYYPPENATIPAAIARALIDRGDTVRVLTGYPNYPDGKIFEGYEQRWRSRERHDEVEVLRVPLFIDHSQSAVRRMLNYASFAASAATARGFASGADVIYVYATQMTPALGPWLWRMTGGAPYVLHVQDLWPDSITGSSLVSSGRGARAIEAVLSPWLRSVYRRAAVVIGIAPTMVDTLIERGVAESGAHLVYNWAEEQDAADGPRPGSEPAGITRLLYAGNVGDMQDLGTAVRAAHQARGAGIQLTVVGDGVAMQETRDLAEELGATNVEFRARVPSHEMAGLYQEADFALVTLKDLPVFRGTIPSKLQAALASGVPVITTVQGDLRTLVEQLGVGFTADAESSSSLAKAMGAAASCDRQQRDALRARARLAYSSQFSRQAGTNAIISILGRAAG